MCMTNICVLVFLISERNMHKFLVWIFEYFNVSIRRNIFIWLICLGIYIYRNLCATTTSTTTTKITFISVVHIKIESCSTTNQNCRSSNHLTHEEYVFCYRNVVMSDVLNVPQLHVATQVWTMRAIMYCCVVVCDWRSANIAINGIIIYSMALKIRRLRIHKFHVKIWYTHK